MNILNDLRAKKKAVCVIGLGYVGLQLAILLAKKYKVVGYDINQSKINQYINHNDVTDEVGNNALKNTTVYFTSDENKLNNSAVYIVAVPTPIDSNKSPDLSALINATKTVARNIKKDSVVIFESTVYPGVTENICVPIIEEESNLKCGLDFKIGYSPERINPGDTIHTLLNTPKVVSGIDSDTTELISLIYGSVINACIVKSPNIRTAEATKIIENTQRDVNIAFINEVSRILNKLDIDTKKVLEIAKTKWNFVDITPGLVGGHCISVDPYYLSYTAQEVGVDEKIVSISRQINDNMSDFIVNITIDTLEKADVSLNNSSILILGMTYKENVSDIRNTKVIDIYNKLISYGAKVSIVDPHADKNEVKKEYGITIKQNIGRKTYDAIIVAVPHKCFAEISLSQLLNNYTRCNTPVLVDIKGFYSKEIANKLGYIYFRL